MTELVPERLEAGDDPQLWEAVLGHVLAQADRTPGMRVDMGLLRRVAGDLRSLRKRGLAAPGAAVPALWAPHRRPAEVVA